MPTRDVLASFWRDPDRLTPEQQWAFRAAVEKFVADPTTGEGFRAGLRVKRVQGHAGVWEMTWAPDGRATFEYGPRPSRRPARHLAPDRDPCDLPAPMRSSANQDPPRREPQPARSSSPQLHQVFTPRPRVTASAPERVPLLAAFLSPLHARASAKPSAYPLPPPPSPPLPFVSAALCSTTTLSDSVPSSLSSASPRSRRRPRSRNIRGRARSSAAEGPTPLG